MHTSLESIALAQTVRKGRFGLNVPKRLFLKIIFPPNFTSANKVINYLLNFNHFVESLSLNKKVFPLMEKFKALKVVRRLKTCSSFCFQKQEVLCLLSAFGGCSTH